jgi:hypothetical protein
MLNRMPSEVKCQWLKRGKYFFSILSASLLRMKNSMGLLTRSECFVLKKTDNGLEFRNWRDYQSQGTS